jgi:hypothetical protein
LCRTGADQKVAGDRHAGNRSSQQHV